MLPERQTKAFNDFYKSVRNNEILDPKTTLLVHMATAMAVACYPWMENYLGVAKDAGITDQEIGVVQAIVMAVSGGRVLAQFGEVQARDRAAKRSEQADIGNICQEAQTCCSKEWGVGREKRGKNQISRKASLILSLYKTASIIVWSILGDEESMYVSNTNAFLTEHLLSWVPRFPEGPFRCDEADFYKGIAKITNCFVMADLMFLGSSPSRVGKSWCS